MIYTDSSGNRWRYKPQFAEEFQFTPEEQVLFEEMQRVMDAYEQRKVPKPNYAEDKKTFLRFRRWQTWKLSQRHPDLFASLFDPVDAE